MKLVYS